MSDDAPSETIDDPLFQSRYRVSVRLGAGSSGEVALCRDARIGRDVAVKVLRARSIGDRDAVSRFAREARVQGRLEHPGVVPVYDVSEGDRRPWFTMKRVRGTTLADVLAGRDDPEMLARFTRARLLAAFSQACRTIAYAHSEGVVHRDLSPRNLMFGEYGEVHVLDWGLARLLDEQARTKANAEDDLSETRPGQALGTPGYLAPEQALGDPDVGPEADVYALGVMLFEICARRPFNPGTNTRERIDHAIRGVVPAFPSGEHAVPPELARLVSASTSPRPADRTSSARDLAVAIEQFLDGDRDLAERTRIADALVVEARAAHARDGGSVEATRLYARALALVPAHPEAGAALSRLLLEPPSIVPPEVHERMARWAEEAWRAGARTTTLRYLLWCSFIPVWFLMGLRDVGASALAMGSLVVTTIVTGLVAAGVLGGVRGAAISFALGTFAIACFTQVFSPVLVAPTLMATNLIAFCAYAGPRQRVALVLASVLGMAIPIALEAAGVIAPSFVVDADGIHVLPRLVSFEPRITWWLLVAGATVAVAVPGVVAGRVRDALVASQQRAMLQAWHLEALVPKRDR